MGEEIRKNAVNGLLLRQHNEVTTSYNNQSATEKNIMYMLMAQLRDDDPEDKIYKIHVREIERLTNSQTGYTYLKSAAKKLISRFYTISTKNEVLQLSPLTAARYKKGTGIIELELSNKIRPFFFALKNNYTIFQFQAAMLLQSKYSKGIYEMLSQFKSTGTFKVSVKELKKRFGLINSETGKEQYTEFGLFADKVLEVAKREINEHTDITFEYETKKTGRKITDLRFKIRSKKAPKELSETTQPGTKSITDLPPELPKMLSTSIEEIPQIASLEKELCERCEIDTVLAKKLVEKGPEKEVRKLMNGLLKKQKAGEIDSLGGYSTTIFRAWLNGAEPKFEKAGIQAKHIPLKPAKQANQTAAISNELAQKLSDLGLGRNTVYGLIVKYGGELESLEKLENAIANVEKAIDRKEIESNPYSIFELLISELNGGVQQFNQRLLSQPDERSKGINTIGSLLASSIPKSIIVTESEEAEEVRKEKVGIWKELIGIFESMSLEEADELVEKYSPADLNRAISEVVEALKNQEIPQESASMIQELYKQLNLA